MSFQDPSRTQYLHLLLKSHTHGFCVFQIVEKVITNGRLTLKSPYLKAVYNGLKDLQDISDLLEIDELAKEKVMPLFKDYWENSPEKFPDMLLFMHDKGTFPTRFGERQLSLDPRLVPGWLGLVG